MPPIEKTKPQIETIEKVIFGKKNMPESSLSSPAHEDEDRHLKNEIICGTYLRTVRICT